MILMQITYTIIINCEVVSSIIGIKINIEIFWLTVLCTNLFKNSFSMAYFIYWLYKSSSLFVFIEFNEVFGNSDKLSFNLEFKYNTQSLKIKSKIIFGDGIINFQKL